MSSGRTSRAGAEIAAAAQREVELATGWSWAYLLAAARQREEGAAWDRARVAVSPKGERMVARLVVALPSDLELVLDGIIFPALPGTTVYGAGACVRLSSEEAAAVAGTEAAWPVWQAAALADELASYGAPIDDEQTRHRGYRQAGILMLAAGWWSPGTDCRDLESAIVAATRAVADRRRRERRRRA